MKRVIKEALVVAFVMLLILGTVYIAALGYSLVVVLQDLLGLFLDLGLEGTWPKVGD